MDFAHTPEDEAFRLELRTWLDVNLPKFLADWGGDEDPGGGRQGGIARSQDRRKDWQKRLDEGRWAAINWPLDWHGREATPVQNVIYSEEMARVRAPGIYNANGLWQIGPMIIHWGNEEQRNEWLPGILSAEEHWCQGFSEPQAGSDLANLRTTAVLDGDEYVVNGQKIWTSTAHLAKWGLFLLRTDPTAIERGAKHEGITAFIIDMDTPGIECRPIRDIVGEEMFNEVWFTDARIPVAHRLGEEGAGWKVAMGTLGHELVGACDASLNLAVEYAKVRVQFDRPLSKFQAIRHKAVDMLHRLELSRVGSHYAAWTSDVDDPARERAVAMAKGFIGEAAIFVSSEDIQVHGGVGFTWDCDAHFYYKRAKQNDILLGYQGYQRNRLADLVLDSA